VECRASAPGLHGSDRVPGAILEADAPNDNAAFSLEFHPWPPDCPWRSPYLLWRMETYTGVKMTQIGFLEFWEFLWTERGSLWRFLKWTGEMDRYVHPGAKNP